MTNNRTKKMSKHGARYGYNNNLLMPDGMDRLEWVSTRLLEWKVWNGEPHCPFCASINVYPMADKDGKRNSHFLWICNKCSRRFTVRMGTIMEGSKLKSSQWIKFMMATKFGSVDVPLKKLSQDINTTMPTCCRIKLKLKAARKLNLL